MQVTLFCLFAALLITSGCTQPIYSIDAANGDGNDLPIVPTSSSEETVVEEPIEPTEEPADPPENESDIKAVVKSLEETDKLIASFRGKIVVVDLWALW